MKGLRRDMFTVSSLLEEESPGFVRGWYLARNPDVAAAVARGEMSALGHFQDYGWQEGRDPGPLFDTSFYLGRYGDVAAEGANPLGHYLSYGHSEGRVATPFFDESYYLGRYGDVSQAVADGEFTAYEHFLKHGFDEGRNPFQLLDEEYYLGHNGDVAASDYSPFQHYVQFGQFENRAPSASFQPYEYAAVMREQGLKLGDNPDFIQHYLTVGVGMGLPVSMTDSGLSAEEAGGGRGSGSPLVGMISSILYNENIVNATAQTLDAAVTVIDTDSGDFSGGTLRLSWAGTGLTEDTLAFDTSGAVSIAGVAVSVGGVLVGNITSNGALGASLTLGLTPYATPGNIETLLRSLTYANNSDAPASSRTLNVTLSDGDGGSTSHSLTVGVTAQNEAPILSSALVTQAATVGAAFSYQFAAGSFTDPDNDSLTYSATLSDGLALPSWLSFNAATRTFSGTPAITDNAALTVTVTATDAAAVTVSGNYTLNVWGTIPGTVGNDVINGTNADELIIGGNGIDTLYGNDGADTIIGSGSRDTLYGGTGNDVFYYDYYWDSRNTFSTYGDTIEDFTQGQDKIYLYGMPYTGIQSGGNNQTLLGYTYDAVNDLTAVRGLDVSWSGKFNINLRGNITLTSADFIFSGVTAGTAIGDVLRGGSGKIGIWGGDGDDLIIGGSGVNELIGQNGNDTLIGGDGEDHLWAVSDNDLLIGNGGDDSLYIVSGSATLDGGAGQDSLNIKLGTATLRYTHLTDSTFSSSDILQYFLIGDDKIDMSALGVTNISWFDSITFDGTYNILTNTASDFSIKVYAVGAVNITGTLTNSDFVLATLAGTTGNDNVSGTGGADNIAGLAGSDTISAGNGNDTVHGGDGADSISAGDGDDIIYGGGGDDIMLGDAGSDELWGGNGSDTISGGRDNYNDTMFGGEGADYFMYYNTDDARYGSGLTADYIMDFEQGLDKITFVAVPFTGIQAGASTGTMLGYTYDAATGYTTILYNTYYAGGGNNFHLKIKGNLALTANDFIFDYITGSGLIQDTIDKDGIVGSTNNDTIIAGSSTPLFPDEIYTGNGDDIVIMRTGTVRILNTGGEDTILGSYNSTNTSFHNVDSAEGNIMYGGNADERFYGHTGNDTVYYGRGDDGYYTGNTGDDFLDGGEGADGTHGLFGNAGNDTFRGGYGADINMSGGSNAALSQGIDEFWYYDPLESSTTETDIISAFTVGNGVDSDKIVLHGFTGIAAGAAAGTVLGYVFDGTHTVISSIATYNFQLKLLGNYTGGGTPFDIPNDFQFNAGILGTNGADGTGAFGATGGGEFIFGLEGNDTIDAGAGNDSVFGGHDADSLAGGLGDDSISGGYANDTLIGGAGADTLEGGSGNDRFVFGAGDSTAASTDVIWDFKHGNDVDIIDLSALGLTGFSDLTITYGGNIFTEITTAGGLQINLLGYYESSTDLTAADFVF